MRKHTKQSLLGFIKKLYEVHKFVEKNIDNLNADGILKILADCQEAAVNIGNIIEETDKDAPTIQYLEEYCDALYNCAVTVNNDNNIKIEDITSKLIKIENSIINDIKIRKEIVFLPYKASMWDSLESIWRAADEDPDCDVYVIPIPYYDRNPDHSFGQAHYEGFEYPADVPIVDYRSYDLEKKHPDIIYIHNPYDATNYVTSVEPEFYSEKLVNYTDMLVYVPYFVLAEIEPDDQKSIDKMKHFITTPAVLNSHKVIVQSENMRKIYINELIKYTGYKEEKYWQKKILGTGSPKLDKIANVQKDDFDIPKDWMNIIKKSDNSWKKIVLYNTGIGAFLRNSDIYFDKIRDVFRVFKENADDIALLWRPHPLLESTIKSMRGHLYEQYIELVSEYKADGWGIYDDTVVLDRAIAISDAYYGDYSSLVQLCCKAGKAVMIQDCDVRLT